jgi:hypothetical protein
MEIGWSIFEVSVILAISARVSRLAYETIVFKVTLRSPPHVEEESNQIAWRSELITELNR